MIDLTKMSKTKAQKHIQKKIVPKAIFKKDMAKHRST
jgi:hypothetical protein